MAHSKNDYWILSRIDFSIESGLEKRMTMTDSVYRVGLISNHLSIFHFPSFLGVANEICFAIDSNVKTKIESDSSNRNANENDCVDAFLAIGSATETSHGLAKQMGT
jgi:hypothetical protein